jgi:hypothetical protein
MIQFVRKIIQDYVEAQRILDEMGIVQIPSSYGYCIYVDTEQMKRYQQKLKENNK